MSALFIMQCPLFNLTKTKFLVKHSMEYFSGKVVKFLEADGFVYDDEDRAFVKRIVSRNTADEFNKMYIEIDESRIYLEIDDAEFEFRFAFADETSNDEVFAQNFKKMTDKMKEFFHTKQ